MTNWLKQSTAATERLGPFLDTADGFTPKTALTIQKADVKLSKDGGAFAAASADQGASNVGAPHDADGYYAVSLNTTDTATLGRLKAEVTKTGALPVWQEWMVVPANVYDALVGGSDKLDVDTFQVTPSAIDANALAASAVAKLWDALLTGITTAGSIGKLIKDNLDAAVSSRSTYGGGDTSGTTTLLSRLTSTRAGNLDNLDAAVSSRLASGSYVAPATPGEVAAVAADVVKVKAAVYDSATLTDAVITLSNGKTQTVTETGRVTSP